MKGPQRFFSGWFLPAGRVPYWPVALPQLILTLRKPTQGYASHPHLTRFCMFSHQKQTGWTGNLTQKISPAEKITMNSKDFLRFAVPPGEVDSQHFVRRKCFKRLLRRRERLKNQGVFPWL